MPDRVNENQQTVEDRYEWQNQKENVPDEALCKKLDTRREELLKILPDYNDNDVTPVQDDPVVQEWLALVRERDHVLHRKIDQENKRALDSYMQELYAMLEEMENLSLKDTKPELRQNLVSLYGHVVDYCKGHNLRPKRHILSNTKVEKITDSVSSYTSNSSMATSFPPPPPPPPPPTPLFNESSINVSVIPTPKSTGKLQRKPRKSIPSTPKSVPRRSIGGNRKPMYSTPLHSLNEELQKQIANGQGVLRKTPGMRRSPGGTPQCAPKRRRISLSKATTSELVAHALQKKFKSVRVSMSPTKDEDITTPSPESPKRRPRKSTGRIRNRRS